MVRAFCFAQSETSLRYYFPQPVFGYPGGVVSFIAPARATAPPYWIAPMTAQSRLKSHYCCLQWLWMLLPTLVLLCSSRPLFAQKPSTIFVDVNVVNVFATVRDKHDHIINNLTKEELRNQYSLGFTPSTVDNATGYHKISLTVKKKGLIVQTRDGYYGKQ